MCLLSSLILNMSKTRDAVLGNAQLVLDPYRVTKPAAKRKCYAHGGSIYSYQSLMGGIFDFPDDATLRQSLFEAVYNDFQVGRPCFLSENRTPYYKFFLDIDIGKKMDRNRLWQVVMAIRNEILTFYPSKRTSLTRTFVFVAEDEAKQGVHLHFDFVVTHKEGRLIVNWLTDHGDKFCAKDNDIEIDLCVHTSNGIRLPYTDKPRACPECKKRDEDPTFDAIPHGKSKCGGFNGCYNRKCRAGRPYQLMWVLNPKAHLEPEKEWLRDVPALLATVSIRTANTEITPGFVVPAGARPYVGKFVHDDLFKVCQPKPKVEESKREGIVVEDEARRLQVQDLIRRLEIPFGPKKHVYEEVRVVELRKSEPGDPVFLDAYVSGPYSSYCVNKKGVHMCANAFITFRFCGEGLFLKCGCRSPKKHGAAKLSCAQFSRRRTATVKLSRATLTKLVPEIQEEFLRSIPKDMLTRNVTAPEEVIGAAQLLSFLTGSSSKK